MQPEWSTATPATKAVSKLSAFQVFEPHAGLASCKSALPLPCAMFPLTMFDAAFASMSIPVTLPLAVLPVITLPYTPCSRMIPKAPTVPSRTLVLLAELTAIVLSLPKIGTPAPVNRAALAFTMLRPMTVFFPSSMIPNRAFPETWFSSTVIFWMNGATPPTLAATSAIPSRPFPVTSLVAISPFCANARRPRMRSCRLRSSR